MKMNVKSRISQHQNLSPKKIQKNPKKIVSRETIEQKPNKT